MRLIIIIIVNNEEEETLQLWKRRRPWTRNMDRDISTHLMRQSQQGHSR